MASNDAERRQRIIELDGGRRIVTAGPGAGKTRLLVDRLTRLLEAGHAPREVLTLVFNRKAAAEIRGRLAAELPDRGFVELRIATFHSFALSLVDRFWREGGFASRPSLLPSDEQRALVRELLQHDDGWDVTDEVRTSGSFGLAVADAVLRAQEQLVGPDELGQRDAAAGAFLNRYLQSLQEQGKVDYAGVLARAAELTEDDAIRDALGVRHLLVDEFQDSNLAQDALVRNLSGDCDSAVVVGDPFQAIYAFRGANTELIEHAPDRLGAERVMLTHGFRCPQEVVDASGALVAADPNLPERGDLTGTDVIGGVASAAFAHRTDELNWIAEQVRRLGAQCDWSEIAILCRSLRALRSPVESALKRAGVPVRIVGGARSAAGHPWVGPLQDLLELATPDIRDDEAVAILESAALSPLVGGDPLKLREAFRRARFRERPERFLREWARENDDEALPQLLAATTRARAIAKQGKDPATVAWMLWVDLPAHERLAEGAREIEDLKPWDVDGGRAVGAWLESLVRFVDRNPDAQLTDYLETLDRADETLDTWLADREDAAPAVQVMTVHQAKGLTFDHVVVPSLEEGAFPVATRGRGILDRLGLRTDETSEERRLLYVAMTRARRTAMLTCTTGTEDKMGAAPSRFLADLADHLRDPDERFGTPDPDSITGVATATQARRAWGRVLRDPAEPEERKLVAAAGLVELEASLPWLGHEPLTPARLLREDPWPLSPTSIQAYDACARQFLFDKVLRLAPFEPAPAAAFGTAVHEAIAGWLKAGEYPSRELLDARLVAAFETHCDEDEIPIRAQRESFRRKLPLVAQLVEEYMEDIGEPIHVEKWVEHERPDGVKVRGRLDLVAHVPEEGLEIVDWKTSSRDRADAADNAQLSVYHYMARAEFGEPVVRLRLAHLKKGKAWADQEVGEDHDEVCAEIVQRTVDGLTGEKFPVGEDPPCYFCAYKTLCDAKLRGREAPW